MIPYLVAALCLFLMFAPIMVGLHTWYRTWRWQRQQQRQWEQEVWNARLQTSLSQINGYRHTPTNQNGDTIH